MNRPVYIYGGLVYAEGGGSGAGIGSGNDQAQNAEIYIYGGDVVARGGSYGAGIGGGGAGGPIYIYGGTINAEGYYGAGIGGGSGYTNGTIYIYGGDVTATNQDIAEDGGAGIGSGRNSPMNNPIYIYGGTVHASSKGEGGAGIGSGSGEFATGNNNSTIEIHGGNVYASRNRYGAGIGGGWRGKGGTIKIYGGYVEAFANAQGAGIGGGSGRANGGDIFIYGGTVKAESGASAHDCQAIGSTESGESFDPGNLYIEDNLKVYTSSNNTTVETDNRVSACRATSGYVLISPCDHAGAHYDCFDEVVHILRGCIYCDHNDEEDPHTFGSDDICTLCGYQRVTTFAISVPESFEHGTVTCDKAEAAEGETVTLTVTPDEGYELDVLTVTTVESEPSGAPLRAPRRASVDVTPGDEPNTYSFAMPAAPVTINATFKETIITGINGINAAKPKTGQRYNVLGQPVGKDYKGIVIEDGVKRVIK